ncbi:MAG: NAD(P)/FAD-dependent oxidoreductase [Anaerolineales bacterium]
MQVIKTDVLIVGGGPAGSACARRLRQNNVRVILLDKANFPRFKPCAGWVTPQVLRSVGMEVESYPYGLTEFTRFDVSINGIKFPLPTHQYSIRRFEFDGWLLHLAEPEFHQHEVKEIRQENGEYVVDEAFSAHYLVGAGGTHCPVYRTFFSQASPKRPEALIVAQEEEFQYEVKDARCKLWFFENKLPGYAWYVPKKDGYVNVGVGGATEQLKRRADTLKRHWNYLVTQLEEAGLIRGHTYKPAGHSYYLRQDLPEIQVGNAFLVGDALGLATADMGEGIGPAIQSGQLAAEAILHGGDYSVSSIPRYSFPSLLGWRK